MNARIIALALAGATLLSARSTSARDDRLRFSIKAALDHADTKTRLDPNIRLYFGDQKHPNVAQDLGDVRTNQKTNATGKQDQDACDWVFLSALLKLEDRARQTQANAIIDIQSNYKNEPFSSQTEYVCGAGTFIAGVALTGRLVKM
jgi:hypothetical protein